MAAYLGIRIGVTPTAKHGFQRRKLNIRKILTANQTDTKADLIKAFDMRANPIIGTAMFNAPITADYPVIANAIPAKAKMHLVNITCIKRLVIGRIGAMHHEITNIFGFQHESLVQFIFTLSRAHHAVIDKANMAILVYGIFLCGKSMP
jgi:hypothetical protein